MKDLELATCAVEARFVFVRKYERQTGKKWCGAKFQIGVSLEDQRMPWRNDQEISPQRAEIQDAFEAIVSSQRANAVAVVYGDFEKVEVEAGSVCRWGEYYGSVEFFVPAKSPKKILGEEVGWQRIEKIFNKKPEDFFEEVLRKEITRWVEVRLAEARARDAEFLADQFATMARSRAEQERGYDGRIRAIREEQKAYEATKLAEVCSEVEKAEHDQDPRVITAAVKYSAKALSNMRSTFGHRGLDIPIEEVL